MQHGIHFISGLPRAGSTVLAGILRQNPRFQASMTGPVGELFAMMLKHMSHHNEFASFIDEPQRQAILTGLFESYYRDIQAEKVVFDTNRLWCSKMPALAALFPQAKVIACVRDVAWIIDSVERLIRHNKFEPSRIFDFEPGGTLYSRVEWLVAGNGMVGFAYNALKEAFYGEQSDRLMLLSYETLTRTPERAMAAVYDFIGEPLYAHDFDHVDYAEEAFDARLGTPGLHRVAPKVQYVERQTILPPDVVHRFANDAFWTNAKLNPRGVRIV